MLDLACFLSLFASVASGLAQISIDGVSDKGDYDDQVSFADKTDSRKIAEFLSQDGQLLLPFLELICNTEQAIDELIDVAGKAAIEAVLLLSAEQLAGPKQPGKSHGDRGRRLP
jgi:hypothetical protein